MDLRPYLPTGYNKNKLLKLHHKKQSSKIELKEENVNKEQEKEQEFSKTLKERPSSKIYSNNIANLMSKEFSYYQKGPQQITATNFMLYDSVNKLAVVNRADQQREIASLTKIMTVIVALEFINKHQLEKSLLVKVSSSSSALNGTSAKLAEGVFVKLYDLLYGAMLPSGNDAAFLLAEVLGLLLFYEKIKPEEKQYEDIESIDLSFYESTVTFTNRFIKEMNHKAKELKMTKTNFSNPHGLGNALNVSTAQDVMILAQYAVNNEEFRSIMSTKEYECEFYDENMNSYCSRTWKNTNKLLELEWEGIKTGHTSSAGCCLASLKEGIFIVVLNSATLEKRFEDTIEIFKWYQERGKTMLKERQENNLKKDFN